MIQEQDGQRVSPAHKNTRVVALAGTECLGTRCEYRRHPSLAKFTPRPPCLAGQDLGRSESCALLFGCEPSWCARPKSAALTNCKSHGPGAGKRVSIANVGGGTHVFFGGGRRSRPSSQNTTEIQTGAIHGLSIDRAATHEWTAAGKRRIAGLISARRPIIWREQRSTGIE